MDVGGWLWRLGLEQYEAAFRENKIGGSSESGVARVSPVRSADEVIELNALCWNSPEVMLRPPSHRSVISERSAHPVSSRQRDLREDAGVVQRSILDREQVAKPVAKTTMG
jgi:hypothetical protein